LQYDCYVVLIFDVCFQIVFLIVLEFLSTGHGPAINDNSIDKIEEYITNRIKREEDILSVLQNVFLHNKFRDQIYGNNSVQNTEIRSKVSETEKTNKSVKESFVPNTKFSRNENYKSSWEIMSKIYGKLPIFVKFSAQSNCLHHLEKLFKENKVTYKWPDLWAVNTHK
jgi:Beta-lactamase associated winged helix domain